MPDRERQRALALGDGRYVVPDNRWHLLDGLVPSPPEISVIVPFFQDQPRLELVLAGLTVQSHPAPRTQVVIADDGSAEPPRVPRWVGALDISVVRQPDRGFRVAAARNLGARHADGEVLVFLDGDTVPEPSYLAELARLPALLPDALVGGRRRHADLTGWSGPQVISWLEGESEPPAELTEPAWLLREYQWSQDLSQVGPRSYLTLIGAVLGCHRDLFEAIGGFDETMVGYGGEDYDFNYRAHTAGAVLAHVRSAVAWHDGPEWTEREQGDDRRVGAKNAEMMALAERIPEPSSRGSGQWYPVCDLIVELDVTDWTLGAAVLSIRSLIATFDCRVWLRGTGSAVETIAEVFAADPRVHRGPFDGPIADRARARLTTRAPLTASARFGELLEQLHRDGIGRLTITAAGATAAEVTATRAIRRSRRWADRLDTRPDDLRDTLFDHARMELAEAGLALVGPQPYLPAVFGGWA